MEVNEDRGTADFVADMTMSDYAMSPSGTPDATQGGQNAHTHHIRLTNIPITWDMIGCPSYSPGHHPRLPGKRHGQPDHGKWKQREIRTDSAHHRPAGLRHGRQRSVVLEPFHGVCGTRHTALRPAGYPRRGPQIGRKSSLINVSRKLRTGSLPFGCTWTVRYFDAPDAADSTHNRRSGSAR